MFLTGKFCSLRTKLKPQIPLYICNYIDRRITDKENTLAYKDHGLNKIELKTPSLHGKYNEFGAKDVIVILFSILNMLQYVTV